MSLSQQAIQVSFKPGFQTLTLNRPGKRNALDDGMYVALTAALNAGEADPQVRAHVLLGQAGVDGLCVGIGTTLLLHCDYIVASGRSVLRAPFVDLGLVPEAASSLLAPRLMGQARAFELLCLGGHFDAARAQQCGLVNEVIEAEQVTPRICAVAAALAAKPPAALLLSRRLLRGDPVELLARIDTEAQLFSQQLQSDEARAAFARFLNKRSAQP
jgi:enoyl-CoA hydratase/carnithine racemase